MKSNTAVVEAIGTETNEYDEPLFSRFLVWRGSKGGASQTIARALKRSEKIVDAYVRKELAGQTLKEFEKDVFEILKLKEDFRYSKKEYSFCQTEAAIREWEVLQYAFEEGIQGLYTAPSGSGKTTTAIEFKKQNMNVILITADICTTKPGSVLKVLARILGCCPSKETLSNLIQDISEYIRHEKFIIVDDAHFLSWQAFESLRTLWDRAHVGMVFLGQERLYSQMRGHRNDSFLYDQIFSRISIRRNVQGISRADVHLVADSICPKLDKDCIDFLFKKAQDQGHFRNLVNILRLSLRMSQEFNSVIDENLLREAAGFLMV